MSKRAKKKRVIVEAQPFGASIVFCFSLEDWRTEKRRYGIESDDEFNGICAVVHGSLYVIAVLDGSVCTLAHEIAHAVFFILGYVGVDTDAGEANETFCYLLENTMKKVEGLMNRPE